MAECELFCISGGWQNKSTTSNYISKTFRYERVKKMSLAYRCAYKFVAAWFEEMFPHYGELLVTDEKGNPVWDAVAMCQKAEEQAAAKPVEAAAETPKLELLVS